MDWQDYRRRYSLFLLSLYQTELIVFHAGKVIPDASINLKIPEDKTEIPFFVNLVRNGFAKFAAGYKSDHNLHEITNIVHLVFGEQKERVLTYHELTMIVAHLEAFVGDTLLAVWLMNPAFLETTPTGKKVAQEEASSLSALPLEKQELIANEALWQLMRKDPKAYLAHFRNNLNLSIEADAELLCRASLDRNAIVHNGGLMSQNKYIEKLNQKDRFGLAAGDPIQIEAQYLVKIHNQAMLLGETIFEEVSKNFFGINTPVKDGERVALRETSILQKNPYEEIARKTIEYIGGPDEFRKNPQKAMAEFKKLLDEEYKR